MSKLEELERRISALEKMHCKDKKLYCGFCGRDQEEVSELIVGVTANICNECVDICVDTINKQKQSN